MRKSFDQAYYDRFYRNPRTRAVTPAAAARQARFIAAYLRYLDMPVKRILDIGCGTGTTLRALGREFPAARVHGVEYSDYLCSRYRWECGSVVDYASEQPWDLVVCNDVLAYLDADDCATALGNIAKLSRHAAFLGILTSDDEGAYDPARTDPRQHRRTAAWYRRRLARHFVNVGGGLYLKQPLEVTVWAMDRIG
jgi:2-polyprenyl-3-methyl-5-hydroxy-6-metoxy-1,4-benzoquinol methylase